jgi:hypothetical protein
MQHRWNLKAPPRSRFQDVSKYLMKAFLMDSHLRLGAATFASIKFQKGHSSISPVKIFIIEVEDPEVNVNFGGGAGQIQQNYLIQTTFLYCKVDFMTAATTQKSILTLLLLT